MNYSFKDFTGWEFRSRPDYRFPPGTTIEGSCFSQDKPKSFIFPDSMTGVRFKRCNLDNVFIPHGNTVDSSCTTRQFQVQNDLRDWEVDDNGIPTIIMNDTSWLDQGYSVDPRDIPTRVAIDVHELRIDVLSGEITIEDILGVEAVAKLRAMRDASQAQVVDNGA